MTVNEFMTGEELGKKLLLSVQQMKAGKGSVAYSPALAARKAVGLSQAKFAELLGVSVRTLQDWEQGRRSPSGAASTLLGGAMRHPEALRDMAT